MTILRNDIQRSTDTLRSGGIILYPTDTIWGIGCDAFDQEAVNRIFSVKQRAGDRSMIILVSEEEMLTRYVTLPAAYTDLPNDPQRPTTVIYQNVTGLPHWLKAPDGSVAIRIVNHPFCTPLLEALDRPIISTSANFSGETAPGSYSEINPELFTKVDYIVESFRDKERISMPSRIIRFDEIGNFEVIRA